MAFLRLLTTDNPKFLELHDTSGVVPKPLFGIEHYIDDEAVTPEGYWIRQETGLADFLLPETAFSQSFANLVDLQTYCEKHFKIFINAFAGKKQETISTH